MIFFVISGIFCKFRFFFKNRLFQGFKNVSNYTGGWWEWRNDWTREEWSKWAAEANFPLNDALLDSLEK